MWRYARGRALVATGDLAGAEAELQRLRELAQGPELAGVRLEFNLSQDVLAIAAHVLAGRLAEARGDHDRAAAELREAARREDALLYGEPPEWTVPVRHELGAVLLGAARPAEAERAYREDLGRFRENGWSLLGLARALEAQGKEAEAAEAETRFRAAWRDADLEIAGSSF